MGHLGRLKEEYRALVDRLDAAPVTLPEPEDAKAWSGWKEILEILFTPEEAELASRMPVLPSTLDTVARRLGMSPEELKPRIDEMCHKGLVMDLVNPGTGKTIYLLSPPVVGFFEFSFMRAHDMFPKKRLAEAMDAYLHGDRAFASQVFGGGTVIGRALVREDRVAAEALPDVLDWERATAIVDGAKGIAVTLCYCRHKREHLGRACDAPKEICLSFDMAADFLVRRGLARTIERAEAADILASARQHGLVQIADNVRNRPFWICNCCGCCCEQLVAINEYALPAVNPSGYEPHMDEATCLGCSRCSRTCPITAISMMARRNPSHRKNELRPHIDLDRCIGCGVCSGVCPRKSLRMKRRNRSPRVPASALEKSLRMAIERGKLPHLLFDQGASRGSRFLNQALHVLQRLPLASRIMAGEQVQSRFVRGVLARVRDPMS
ncbi:MAG: 4Fe-4S dicluster domain-containing protein [Acidobacteria bacterium]|nr:4Fe-4S dicluster domain-containing protein [Acidobacteriota bacterium]